MRGRNGTVGMYPCTHSRGYGGKGERLVNRCSNSVLIWCLCIPLAGWTQERSLDGHDIPVDSEFHAPTITVAKPDISGTALKMAFEIRNTSEQDVWICEDISVRLHSYDCEAFMVEDRETLLIRRRLDIDPYTSVPAPPHGRYVRLPPGQSRRESLLLSLPVKSRFFWGGPTSEGRTYAKRLALEIGYYAGDLPGMIHRIITEPASPHVIYDAYTPPYSVPPVKDWFRSTVRWMWYNWPNKHIRHRDEEVIIPWTGSTRMGERVLRTSLDGLTIRYEETYEGPTVSPPDLRGCDRLEIVYQPSALDYFFPYPHERDLMNSEELASVQSLRKIVVDDRAKIATFSQEIAEQNIAGGIISERSSAQVVCYRNAERLTSLTIYDDRTIVTESGQCIRCPTGIPSMKGLAVAIIPFQSRLDCGSNLMNLSWLLHFLYGTDKMYPASQWCSALVEDRRVADVPVNDQMRYLMCPSRDQGKCHYAMNPNCKPNSVPDMVLLFETKAGWNQRGGPELFTFDNHTPRGGLVLLNDGTVKFIRTEEELKQLRWK